MSSDVNAVYGHLGGTSESSQMEAGRPYQGTVEEPEPAGDKCL